MKTLLRIIAVINIIIAFGTLPLGIWLAIRAYDPIFNWLPQQDNIGVFVSILACVLIFKCVWLFGMYIFLFIGKFFADLAEDWC